MIKLSRIIEYNVSKLFLSQTFFVASDAGRLTPRQKPVVPISFMRLVGPQIRSRHGIEQNNPSPAENRTLVVQFVTQSLYYVSYPSTQYSLKCDKIINIKNFVVIYIFISDRYLINELLNAAEGFLHLMTYVNHGISRVGNTQITDVS
jgi:hypothetical protein